MEVSARVCAHVPPSWEPGGQPWELGSSWSPGEIYLGAAIAFILLLLTMAALGYVVFLRTERWILDLFAVPTFITLFVFLCCLEEINLLSSYQPLTIVASFFCLSIVNEIIEIITFKVRWVGGVVEWVIGCGRKKKLTKLDFI